ncbi:uncharacterized protein GABA-B-R3 [Hetaerina americana]|uniref:uncharacterized protein GABA-B-R3 n=1 Tax=Hetaerina americana TaxID=62018 RepID=UPI003A7F201F
MEPSEFLSEEGAQSLRLSLPPAVTRPVQSFQMSSSRGQGRSPRDLCLPPPTPYSVVHPTHLSSSSAATALLDSLHSPWWRALADDRTPLISPHGVHSAVPYVLACRFIRVLLLISLLSVSSIGFFPSVDARVPLARSTYTPEAPGADAVDTVDTRPTLLQSNATANETIGNQEHFAVTSNLTIQPILTDLGPISLFNSVNETVDDFDASIREDYSNDYQMANQTVEEQFDESNQSFRLVFESRGDADLDLSAALNHTLRGDGEWKVTDATDSPGGILLDPGGNDSSPSVDWTPSGGYFSRMRVYKSPPDEGQGSRVVLQTTERDASDSAIQVPATEYPDQRRRGTDWTISGPAVETTEGVSGTVAYLTQSESAEQDATGSGPEPGGKILEPEEERWLEHRAERDSHDLAAKGERSKGVVRVSVIEPPSEGAVVRDAGGLMVGEPGNATNSTRRRIAILGLFEMTSKHGERLEGKSEEAAARLAIRHINEGSPARGPLIPGFELELLTNDTKCDPGVGVDAFFHALYTRRGGRMVSLLGTACSEVTESLAKVAPYWNILQVSYGSTSPALSDRREFPLFFRTVAPDSSHNPARLAFVSRFKWDTVTALSQNEDVFSLAVNDLVTELEQANVSCRSTVTFGENDFKVQLRMLRDLDTRIIIGSFSQEVAPKIFCEAHRLGMYGADYAWILQGSPADAWWLGNRSTLEIFGCTPSALSLAVEGLLMVSSHNSIVGDHTPSFSGLTNSMFISELASLSLPVTKYAPQAYDAVWAIALALRHGDLLKRAADFDYHQKDLAADFLSELAKVQFLGVSGPVSFSGADRVGISAFYQIQGGQVKKVALYYPEEKNLDFDCPQCVPPIWQGGQVPIAKRVFKVRVVTIDPVAFMSISCLAILGICLAFAFLGFNLYFRKLKYIKLSSPKLNNMAVIGCILVYMAVILLGLDHATLPEGNFHFAGICTARAYLLSAGFSLAFGSMFTKTYRVHRIFTRSRSGVVKNKMLQDTQLMSLICVLLLMDGLMVTLWVSVDPMQRHLKNLSLEISTSDRSVVYQPQVEVCRSQHTHGWLGALYVYKGLLLVAGLYMAWETRRVQIPALNDSQYIGASVYSVVITSVIVVVLANLISDRATLAFVTITALIFASTTTTLCLLFVPKIHTIWIHPDGDPIVESMGLKIECNTRRFVIDEKREMYYRVEVQNRVYRRELAALDLDISRLERQLSESPAPSTSTNSPGDSPKKVAIVEEESEIQTEESNAEGEMERSDYHDRDMNCGSQTMVHLQVAATPAPRASWPSADPGPRRHVSFGSQPDLDERRKVSEATSVSAIPLPTSSSSSSSTHAPSSVLRRLLHFAQLTGEHGRSSRPKRGLAGTSASGAVAAALRHHVKYVANLVPAGSMPAAPEIVIVGKPPSSRSGSVVFADPVISITHNGDVERGDEWDGEEGGGGGSEGDSEEMELPKGTAPDEDEEEGWDPYQETDSRLSSAPRKFSLSACLSGDDDDPAARGSPSHDHRQHRRSHGNTRPPPAPSFRERARGSPRFPHKIVPAVACGSMGELRDWRGSNSSGIGGGGGRVRLKPPSASNAFGAAAKLQRRHPNLLMGPELPGKCRSLDASMDQPHHGGGSGAGSGGGGTGGGGGSSGGGSGGEPNRVLSKGICLRCGGVRPRRSSSGTCSAVGLRAVGILKFERGPERDGGRSVERAKCECLDTSRAASLSPNCDVWCVEQADERLQDFIPLSELLVSSAGGGPMELTTAKRTDSQC